MAITILEGSNFCISDQNGDFTFTTSGLYAYDMRFLSHLELTINGERPLLLSAGKAEYYSAAFFLRNPVAGELPQDSVSIGRHRFVGEGMQDRLRVQNQTHEPVSFELALEFANDFADIFAVKNHDFALGDPRKAAPLPPLAEARYEEDGNQFVLEDDGGEARTQIILSQRGHIEPGKVRFWIELESQATWDLNIDVVPTIGGDGVGPEVAQQRFGEERDRIQASLASWNLRVPRLRASLGRPRPRLSALGRRSRIAEDPRRRRPQQPAGSGHAVVHDRLRARHDHHLPADASLRPRARGKRPRSAQRAPGP